MRTKAFTLVEVCVSMIVVGMAASSAMLCLRQCKPTEKCVARQEDVMAWNGGDPFPTWCLAKTRRALEADGLVDIRVNFPDRLACQRYCGTNGPPSFSGVLAPNELLWLTDEDQVPANEEYVSTDVWSSTDLRTWEFYGNLSVSSDGDWMEATLEATNTARFFRVVKVYDLRPL